MLDAKSAQKAEALLAEIRDLKTKTSPLEKTKQNLVELGQIDSIAGLVLYRDRVVGQGRTIKLDSSVTARVESGGSLSYSTEVSGGGSRPTLTRVALGAAVAGPLGAVVGGAAQKKKKIKTTTVTHDSRTLRIIISGDSGHIDIGVDPNQEARARAFVSSLLNAKAEYPAAKKQLAAKRKELVAKIKKLEASDPLTLKEHELDELLTDYTKQERAAVHGLYKSLENTFLASIIGLCLVWIPVISTIIAIVALVKTSNSRKYGLYRKRLNAISILAVITMVINIPYSAIALTSTPDRTFELDGTEVTVVCKNGACSKLDGFGDGSAVETLARLGVRKITEASKNTTDKSVTVDSYESAQSVSTIRLKLCYDSDFTRIEKIVNDQYEQIVYYALDGTVETVEYPASELIQAERDKATEAEAKAKAEAEAAAAAAAAAQAAEDAKYPTETGTRELCERAFHQNYPFNDSTVHSILGVHALARTGDNQMVYKVDVTVENAYGATYDAVMECVVSRDAGTDIIRIDSFYVY